MTDDNTIHDIETLLQPVNGPTFTCRHCNRVLVFENGHWVDPEATGDDVVWRETCDANNEDRVAAHEPHAHLIQSPIISVTVTRSAGDDRAVTIHVDTTFEPDGSDGGPGLRILLNDDEAHVGKAYDMGAHHKARSVRFEVSLADIDYTD